METKSFGSRARVATLAQKIRDATEGNRDGVVGNERQPANRLGIDPVPANPILFALRQAFSVGWTKRDEEARVFQFIAGAERRWGQTVTNLDKKPAHVDRRDWNAYCADKAIALVRFNRTPADVEDLVVPARGSVNGEPIDARDIFVQRFKPQGTPTAKTVVIAPGFLETGRNYLEQAMLLSEEGHDVYVLDQQWAGLSQGDRGRIDRGFGIARDVAAVAARAAADAEARGEKADIVLMGTSMGGGAGAYGAAHLNDAGLMKLEGPEMPKNVDCLLQDPFFGRKSSIINATLAATGLIPFLNEVPLPAFGLPILTSDPVTKRKIAAHVTTERIAGRPQAFHASTEDLAFIKGQLAAGVRPGGNFYVIHARHDTLADYGETQEWVKLLGDRAEPRTLPSDSHVISENPAEQRVVLEGFKWLAARRAAATRAAGARGKA